MASMFGVLEVVQEALDFRTFLDDDDDRKIIDHYRARPRPLRFGRRDAKMKRARAEPTRRRASRIRPFIALSCGMSSPS